MVWTQIELNLFRLICIFHSKFIVNSNDTEANLVSGWIIENMFMEWRLKYQLKLELLRVGHNEDACPWIATAYLRGRPSARLSCQTINIGVIPTAHRTCLAIVESSNTWGKYPSSLFHLYRPNRQIESPSLSPFGIEMIKSLLKIYHEY